jgi:hypothetical protein
MNKLRYQPIVLLNLVLLKASVFVTEWALEHRQWIGHARTYAPVFAGGLVAYFVGRVVGQAILTL